MNQFKENNTFLQLPENARARSLLKSMGYDSQDLRRPRIGVANTWGETSPGHVHLRGVGDAVKAGIWQAGGTPFEFNSAAQCPMAVGEHGMRYDLPTRDIIAAWKPPPPRVHDGFLTVYAKLANPAELGGGLNLRLP
jgi:dihydroxy-acid dehydratase